ncbi:MAG TPA: prephenate dehydrogenase/arogenate dehydrogenase family protein [Acidobacteriaceae bacterium]|nr:prephenate dehydrogenase/arogenate dehydrogenase family protein [Acidobacteriaceae bacterium]
MKVLIIGTGLIGASIGLALKSLDDFSGEVLGWDAAATELQTALRIGAIDRALDNRESVLKPDVADIVVLATPVLPILDWMERLAPVLGEAQLVTDVGSTKLEVVRRARSLFNQPGRARFLPGHPMAGKEAGGAALAEPELFRGAAWLFTPVDDQRSEIERQWIALVGRFGARVMEMDAARHDEVCAWVSHLPQMLSTALAALLEETFAGDPEGMAAVQAIGGRALRETTRLGASPYSMWRDVALTNTEPIARAIAALEQRLQHVRENLRTPALRDEFRTANRFREKG